jgi:amino acid transporter
VSTITSLSVLVAVAATLLVVGLIWAGVVVWRLARRRLREGNWEARWRAWRDKWDEGAGVGWMIWRGEGGEEGGGGGERAGEVQPLLGSGS